MSTYRADEIYRVLARTEAILKKSGAWCRGAFAKTKTGRSTNVESKYATCFCFEGAMHRATFELGGKIADDTHWDIHRPTYEFLIRNLPSVVGPADSHDAISFNDTLGRTQSEVVGVVRKLKELRRAEVSK